MALTVTDVTHSRTVVGDRRFVVANVTFDSSYPTGGEAITPATFGLSSVDTVLCYPHQLATRIASYDHTNSKILLYTALSTEAANASDQSTITIQVQVIGN